MSVVALACLLGRADASTTPAPPVPWHVVRVAPDAVRAGAGDTLTVFNVGGNKYRLIVRIRYDYGLVNVRSVLTHEEYGRGAWRE